MSSQMHIGRALGGAFALARFDRKGLEYFDFSFDGFWRSFQAAAWALPVVAVTALLTPQVMQRFAEEEPNLSAALESVPQNVTLFTILEGLSFIAGWAFFPLAMIWVARLLNLGSRYVPLIVAYNWGRLLTTYAALVPVILFGVGVLSDDFLVSIQFVIFIYILAYRWFIIRSATEAAGMTAFGLMLFDVLGTFLVQTLFSQIYWLFEPAAGTAVPGTT